MTLTRLSVVTFAFVITSAAVAGAQQPTDTPGQPAGAPEWTEERVVIETYAPDDNNGISRFDSRLVLSERVRRTTTATADGGSRTVEEVEGRSRPASNEPLQVIRRSETTVRPLGTGRSVTEQRVFERDVNGRMRLVFARNTEDRAAW